MWYVSARSRSLTVFGLASLLVLNGCVAGKSSSASSSSSVANVSGKVSSTSSSSLSKPTSFLSKAMNAFKVGAMGVDGCTVKAYDLTTNDLIATTTTANGGKYTLTGVASGSTYKIVATCGSNSFSSVATAVVSDPASVKDADRVSTDPRSSVIAAYIVQSILAAVDSAVAAAPSSAQAAVKKAILASLDTVIQTITASINAAIDSGSMAEPDTTTASNVTTAVASATDTTSANAAVAAAPTPPTSVTQAVSGAQSSSLALQACNASMGGTASSCTVAMAKMMYNALGFPVGVLISGGAFGLDGTCTATTPVNGTSTKLGDIFPAAKFETNSTNSDIPAEFCAISPLVAAPDRNRGYQDGGDNHGPVFAETGTASGTVMPTGMLTRMSNALLNNYTYNLASIDNLIFGSQSGAGMNARLISRQFTVGAGLGSQDFKYFNGSAWVNSGWINTCEPNGNSGGMGGTSACSPNNIDWSFSGGGWSSTSSQTGVPALVASIGSGSDASLGVLYHKFGGSIPNQAQIDSFIDQGRTHVDYNTKGERELQLITTKYPGFAANNPCWDNDPTTQCLDNSGAAIVAAKVDLTFGTAVNGVKPITTITANAASGAYYMRPYFGMNGFSGIIGFVKVSDGLIVRDELMRDRAIKVVFASSESNLNGLPGSVSANEMYNVAIDWSSCNGGGSNCPGWSAYSTTSITPAGGFSLAIQSNYMGMSQMYCGGSGCWQHNLIGFGSFGQSAPYKFTVAAVGSAHDTLTYAGTGLAGSGEFNLVQFYDCTSNPCVPSGFFLVDSAGVPHSGDGAVIASMGYPGGSWTAIENYSLAEIDAAAGADFNPNVASAQSLEASALTYNIAQGPIRNPNFQCDAEPFFIDGNGNNSLDCEVSGGFSQVAASSGDRSFSSMEEYNRWLNDPSVDSTTRSNRALMHLQPRDNAFQFGDPVGTKKLMSAAFNGWFDGQHTLAADTKLNALQVFGLLYMFMSQGGDYTNIDGLISNQSQFKVMAPLFEGGNNVPAQNEAIGKAFDQFKLTP